MAKTKQSSVPRGSTLPIEHLVEAGVTIVSLAEAWGLTTDGVYKLRRYDYAPKVRTAEKMAKSFGWTAGEVINHWLGKVAR